MPDLPDLRWRTGRTLGRTLYVQLGKEPSKHDHFIGIMDTKEAANLVVRCVNYFLDAEIDRPHA